MKEDEYPKAKYGQWAGNPYGHHYRPERCAEEIAHGWLYVQCSRKSGHGPRELFCKQHAKRFVEEQ